MKRSKKDRTFSIRVNDFRRKVMYNLTKDIGKSNMKKALASNSKVDIKRVLIMRPNHRLGNLLLTTPLIQELTNTFPDCKIDILVKGNLAPILYKNYDNINNYIVLPRKPFKELITYAKVWLSVKFKTYDLVINAVKDSSSGKLLTQFSNAKYKVFDEVEDDYVSKVPDSYHIAKNPIYNLRNYLKLLGVSNENTAIPLLDIKLSQDEIDKGKAVLDELVKNEKKTIGIYTFATGAKCYSKVWWNEFYTELKLRFKEFNIIEILPFENVSQIDFAAPSYYSKDLREIAAVMENTVMYVGADCGIMHLAAATKTSVVGMFSTTDINRYKPYGNNNIALNTNTTKLDEWMNEIEKVKNKTLQSVL